MGIMTTARDVAIPTPLQGAKQNSGDDGPHFDLARPGEEANNAIQVVIEWLKQQGVE